MTVIADDRKCVRVPTAEPGDRFDLQYLSEGKIVLTPLSAGTSGHCKVTIRKVEGYSVGVLDRPIDAKSLQEALNDFP